MSRSASPSSLDEYERPIKRRAQTTVAANRAVNTLLHPHVQRMGDWTARAAHLNTMALAHVMSDTERAQAVAKAKALLSEIETSFELFRGEVADHEPHGRIEDVRRSYQRLITMLGGE